MRDVLDAELDRLFQLPPGELVAARDGLVAQLRKQGQAESATRVKALKKPTPSAWALNQLHFQQRSLLEQALTQTAHVRELGARDGADPNALRAAVEAQRKTVQRVVEAASACWPRAGIASSSDHQRKLLATVQAWLAGSGDEQPGRMTHDLDPPGFEAVGAVGLAAARAPVAAAAKTSESEHDAHLERTLAELAGRERAVQAARERARNQQTQEERAVAHQQQALNEVRRAEAALATARAQLEERSTALERARAERVDADRELVHAEHELASAQRAVPRAAKRRG